jgi:maltose O-acetyltransferase
MGNPIKKPHLLTKISTMVYWPENAMRYQRLEFVKAILKWQEDLVRSGFDNSDSWHLTLFFQKREINHQPVMTELEKMLAGKHYDTRDPDLLEKYYRARMLVAAYNSSDPRDKERRNELLTSLLGKKGDGVWIESPFYCDYGFNIEIGENTFVNINCILLDDNKITIGKNGLLAPYVQIYTAVHPLKAADRIFQDGDTTRYRTSTKPVTIGDNVWIGGNAVILPGVRIGDNVTIGAGSIVTKDIPDNVLAFGNPCQVVKQL